MSTEMQVTPANERTTWVAAPRDPEPAPLTVIRPLETADAIAEAWEAYEQLKARVLSETDIIELDGRRRLRKSGWRKIATAFGISTTLIRETQREGSKGQVIWDVVVRASAPSGRHADGTASCDTSERRFAHAEHDVRAMAFTRAVNRAISDLVGGGEVSAEEIDATPPEPAYQLPGPEARQKLYDTARGSGLSPAQVDALFSAPVGPHDLIGWLAVHRASVDDAKIALARFLRDEDPHTRAAAISRAVDTLVTLGKHDPATWELADRDALHALLDPFQEDDRAPEAPGADEPVAF